MAGANFYLKKDSKNPNKEALILLRMKYSGISFTYSTGEKIEPSKWNSKKQEPKSKSLKANSVQQDLHEYLKGLKHGVEGYFKSELKDGIPSQKMLKEYLDKKRFEKLLLQEKVRLDEEKKVENSLYSLIDRFIEGQIRPVAINTRKNYKAVKKHLQEFEKETRYRINYESINLDFFYRYTSWLTSKGIASNTQAKDIRIIKVFMQEAVDLDFTENLKFRHKKFTVKGEDTDSVALSEIEIMKIYRTKIKNIKLDRVRDLFVFGCFTGLRFSDYSRVEKENIVDIDGQLMIKIVTQKTSDPVIIPTNPVIVEILKKYEQGRTGLPKALSNQKFNEYVKDVCKEAGLVETGRLSGNLSLPLYACISSHTARRSFCTNLYLSGFPARDIMLISGHKSEKAFNKYIKISKLSAAKRLAEHQRSYWSKLMLQAV